MKIKILYVIPKLERAGAEQHLVSLVKNLNKDMFEPYIYCVKDLGALGVSLSGNDRKVISLNRKNIYDLRILFDIYKAIKRYKFDIVHAYLFGFNYLATIPAKICGVPFVISSRRELADWKKPHHHLLERLSNIFTDKIVACSEAARRFALRDEQLAEEKVVTIYNGINLNEFSPRQKDAALLEELGFNEKDIIVGMVTKLAPVKDVGTALEAIAKAKKEYPGIKCIIVGGGYQRLEMEDKARTLGINGNVKLLGLRDDISRMLSIMDVFLLTSLSEGFPNSILEAMACGLPVVATKVGGIPEVVTDNRSGILVESNNPAATATAIIRLLKDENLRKDMGRCAREIIEQKFNLSRMASDYEQFYYSLLEKESCAEFTV